MEETKEYYRSALDPVFTVMKQPAYITVGRWSYAPGANNPLVFNPGGVGSLDEKLAGELDMEFETNKFLAALKDFSLTKLLADTDQEVWFHFTNQDPPEKAEEQVYIGTAPTPKRTSIIEVAAAKITTELVQQMVIAFESLAGPTFYGSVALSSKTREIKRTLEVIFSMLNKPEWPIWHVSFMPVTLPSDVKNVVGILSINSEKHIKVAELEPILQPYAEGIMAPFHLHEIDDQRKAFSLRSAIAAIMSRNMSHNIGSHVLWHLSQQLRKI